MLYIMRHGQTDWNKEHKLQGRTDIPLNEEGIMMAEKAATEYASVNFDVCFCSPLVRAQETAKIVLKNRDIPITIDDRLIEMSFGDSEGKVYGSKVPDCAINIFFSNPEEYIVPVENGESLEELYERTGSFLKEKVEPLLEQGKDVLIVGHGAMNSSIICQIKDIPIHKFWSEGIENCKLKQLM